ncbi:hypothetical protein VaNZ11_008962, partial [Volvox africanus]
ALDVLRRVTHQATIPVPPVIAEPSSSEGLVLRFPTLEFRSLLLNAIGRDTFPDRGIWKRHKVALCGLLLHLADGDLPSYGAALESLVEQFFTEDRDRRGPSGRRQGRARGRTRTRASRRESYGDGAGASDGNSGVATTTADDHAAMRNAGGDTSLLSGASSVRLSCRATSPSCVLDYGVNAASAGNTAAIRCDGGIDGIAGDMTGRTLSSWSGESPSSSSDDDPPVLRWVQTKQRSQTLGAPHGTAAASRQEDFVVACTHARDEQRPQTQQQQQQQQQQPELVQHQRLEGDSEEQAPVSGVPHSRMRSAAARWTSLRTRIDAWCRATVGGHAATSGAVAGQPIRQPTSMGCRSYGCSGGNSSSTAFMTLRPLLEQVLGMGEPAPLVDIRRNGSHTELQTVKPMLRVSNTHIRMNDRVASLMADQLPEGWRLICGATILAVDGQTFVNRKRLKGEADLLLVDPDNVVQAVVEVKTAKGNPYVALYDDISKLLELLRLVRNRRVTFRHGTSPQISTLDFARRLRPIYVLGCGGAALGLDVDVDVTMPQRHQLNSGSGGRGGGATRGSGVSVLRSAWSKLVTMELGRELSAASSSHAWSAIKLTALSREVAVLQLPSTAYEPLARRVAAYFARLAHCKVYLVDTGGNAGGCCSNGGSSGDSFTIRAEATRPAWSP